MSAVPISAPAGAGGRFITFEGGEGVGKSTQLRRLAERLQAAGVAVTVTREPGGSPRAEQLRAFLLSGKAKRYGTSAETALIAAGRADHVDRLIRPALKRGDWVLCDRFIDSTRCYQGVLGQAPERLIAGLERLAARDVMPDLTLILDAPASVGLGRARRRAGLDAAADRFESEDESFHQRLREAFIEIARHEPERCLLIDALGDADAVAARIWDGVVRRWPELATQTKEAAR
ncbi:dTMP kinase [Methylopila turkensis]|uniref:Thymidylate kinase n=1 Tax=Methylopila turkensis TaxID=1437816 RepID=A0A9W6JR80_9HYPH|nr:dTMP kinase [Methylopila turkensis]GLK80973.1 thymidylate kinase [Methylopila turkensis]